MLGEKIGEISGKVTMQPVLPNLGGDPKLESSFQATGISVGHQHKKTQARTRSFSVRTGRNTAKAKAS